MGHIKDKWSEPLRTWFPEGKDDPQLALIRVHPERGEFWDSPSSTVMYLYGYAKAALTGASPTELADVRKVDLS
jgi:general stress protein 26